MALRTFRRALVRSVFGAVRGENGAAFTDADLLPDALLLHRVAELNVASTAGKDVAVFTVCEGKDTERKRKKRICEHAKQH